MQKNFLALTRQSLQSIILLFGLLQVCFHFDTVNILCVFMAQIGWIITDAYLFTGINFSKFTLSSVVILGFSITQFLFPTIFTFVDGNALTNNLNFPTDVFIHSLLGLLVLIVCHKIYTQRVIGNKFNRKIRWQKVLVNYDFFTLPTEKQLWIMGFIGQIATIFQMIFTSPSVSAAGDGGTVAAKFLVGFAVFSAAPYFLVLKRMYGNYDEKPVKKFAFKIAAYTILQIVVGIISNSRGAFMGHLTGLGICYFISLLMGKYSIKKVTPFKVVLFFVGLNLILTPLTDLSLAMVAVRAERKEVKGLDLVKITLEAYGDKANIKRLKSTYEKVGSTDDDYSENYLNSIFLSRFCNLKFNDNSLESYIKIGGIDNQMQEYAYNRLIAIFPTPFLEFIGVKIDKSSFTGTSFGDYIYFRAGGPNALGGLRTGHFAGVGMVTFGWWYLLLLAIGLFPLYFLFDLFVICKPQVDYFDNENSQDSTISLAGLISITLIFTFLGCSTSGESITNIFTFLIRGWIQLVALYIILFKITKLI